MALATTTLSAAVAVNDVSITVASATSVAAGREIIIDQEKMKVGQSYVSGTTVPVQRGIDGTATAAHKSGANVTHFLSSDPALPAPQATVSYLTQRPVLIQSYSATGTMVLPPPGCDLRVILNGTNAITLTIPVPTKELDGCLLLVTGNGAAAHLYTFTGGLSGAGTSYDVVTVNATAPSSVMAIASNGLWNAICAPAMGGTVTNLIGSVA